MNPVCSQRQVQVLKEAHTPPQLEDAGCRDSELPVIHLQVFQICDQAEDPTVVLRLAALEAGDGSDWTEQLGQSLRSTPLDLRERDGRIWTLQLRSQDTTGASVSRP